MDIINVQIIEQKYKNNVNNINNNKNIKKEDKFSII